MTGHTFGTVFKKIHNELGLRRICVRWIRHRLDKNAMGKKRPGMLKTAILQQDNASSHRAAQTTETIKRLGLTRLDNPLTHLTWPLVIVFYFH